MKVEEIMTKDPACCTPEDNVEVAAEIMRRLDTGIVPVSKELSQPSRLLGVVTDRDICLGWWLREKSEPPYGWVSLCQPS